MSLISAGSISLDSTFKSPLIWQDSRVSRNVYYVQMLLVALAVVDKSSCFRSIKQYKKYFPALVIL
jgi:hypothetical protein